MRQISTKRAFSVSYLIDIRRKTADQSFTRLEAVEYQDLSEAGSREQELLETRCSQKLVYIRRGLIPRRGLTPRRGPIRARELQNAGEF
ncbi:hypothetical protein J6590_087615 [Homalodisca vitripennis]|nr:hypothetical protein J6590_087615 [Homalodisca vitripennis]